MQYTISRLEKGKVEVKVDVAQSDFEKTYGVILGELGKDVKVDGFRPGNIPSEIVENKVGGSKVLNEAANFLVSNHLAEIFEKEGVVPVTRPKVAIDSLSKGAPFSFVANLVERPKVKLGEWKQIKLKKMKAKEVSEKDVNESIKNIHDAWKKQKDAKGTEHAEAEEPTGKFIYDAHGNKIPLKEDKNAGDGGKIDDEFAKKIGARDLLHLQELVKHDLETMVTDSAEQKFEEEIFDELVKVGEVEVPDVMVDDEVNRIMMRINQQLEQQGKKLEDYVREENTTVDAMRAKFREQAEKNVKATLILDEIGNGEKIEVSREEIENTAKGMNQTDLSAEQKVDMERYVAVSIFQAKTLDLVKKALEVSL